MTIDLDKARAARREAGRKPPTLKFNKKEYDLPVELAIETVEYMNSLSVASKAKNGPAILEALTGSMKTLLGDQYEEFMKDKPSMQDISAVVEGLPAEYGVKLPESSPSVAPSKKRSTRSRQPSKPNTE